MIIIENCAMNQTAKDTKLHILLLLTLSLIFIWSLINCFDFFTWLLEALPAVIGVAILMFVYRRFRLTNLAYILIWVHAVILLIGAHYTYSRMPVFNWLRDALELSRNHYDRLGHFAQGFCPAIIAREVLLRKSPLKRGKWLFVVVLCICAAISAWYELFEWAMAIISGSSADNFLARQGDVWDTQKDMALCLLGSFVSLLTLGRLHDKALEKLSVGHN